MLDKHARRITSNIQIQCSSSANFWVLLNLVIVYLSTYPACFSSIFRHFLSRRKYIFCSLQERIFGYRNGLQTNESSACLVIAREHYFQPTTWTGSCIWSWIKFMIILATRSTWRGRLLKLTHKYHYNFFHFYHLLQCLHFIFRVFFSVQHYSLFPPSLSESSITRRQEANSL